MQAIILAAGMGRRLGKYTKDNTKCMVEVNDERLIDRLLRQLHGLNLNRVIIVTGYKSDNLTQYVKQKYVDNGQMNVEFVENKIYDRTNNIYSLSLVKDKMQEDDTLLIESDLIFSDALLPMLANAKQENVALVAKYQTWMDGTMVMLDEQNQIVNFVSKKAFRFEDADQYYKTVNAYKFSRNFAEQVYVPFLDAYCSALGTNEYYEQVLRVITLLDKTNITALDINDEKWYEIDDEQDLDIAKTIFANDNELIRRFNMRFGGHWRFPSMLDYCYLVNPYFPPKRMKEELRHNFDTLLTEYPSGMFVNSLLAGKYFGVSQNYIVVGNGAAELIKSLMENNSGKIGVVYPTFEEYPNRLNAECIVAYIPTTENLSYNADDLMKHFEGKGISSLLIINPDNPSGNFIRRDDVLRLAHWCNDRDIRLVVDESFVDFSDEFETSSLLDDTILESNPNMVVVKSISKSYGVPGLRLGVLAAADEQLIATIKRDVSIWNINSFAEYYMQIFGKYEADYTLACKQFIAERQRFERLLHTIDYLEVFPTQANYFLCKVKQPHTAEELTLRLLRDHKIIIKDCNGKTSLKGRNMIRISIRDSYDNDKFINALRSI